MTCLPADIPGWAPIPRGTGLLPVLLRGPVVLSERCESGAVVNTADWSDIQASLNGNADGYARLVRRYQNDVGGYLWRFTRSREAVEELTQQVFVEVYFSLGRFRGDAPFGRWLRRIATRVGYRHWKELRRRRAEVELSEVAWDRIAGRSPAEPLDAQTAGSLLHGLLAQLPPRDRLVLTLMYLEGQSVSEAAELTGWSQTMVKVQAYRARGKLRKLMESRGVLE